MSQSVERLHDRPVWWHALDMSRNLLLPLLGFLGMLAYILSRHFTKFDILLFVVFFLATGIGATVGFHRLFSHQAFKAKPWLRYTLAVLGSFAWQRPLFAWVVRHRLHHAHTDQKGDFHSPYIRYDGTPITGTLKQFLHAHYTWLHWYDPIIDPHSPLIKDLYSDQPLRWIDKHYDFLTIMSLLVPGMLSALYYGTADGFVRGVVWGGLGRIFISLQLIWLVSSVTHMFGKKPYITNDGSTNNHFLGWLVMGEGYHNNHHAFPSSPCVGFDKGQFDLGWLFIKAMWKLGQAYDLNPIPEAGQRQFRKSAQRQPSDPFYHNPVSR